MTSSENSSIKIINNFVDVAPFASLVPLKVSGPTAPFPGIFGESRPSRHAHLCAPYVRLVVAPIEFTGALKDYPLRAKSLFDWSSLMFL
jgi:hypothetical protein